jgi:hypothetical protein
MAFEEVTTMVEQVNPKKPKLQKGKLLSSMKKKFINGVEVMDTELRKNVPVKQVQKETQEFVNAMESSRKMTENEIANKLRKKP